jgi:hypothetical protein
MGALRMKILNPNPNNLSGFLLCLPDYFLTNHNFNDRGLVRL